jgi:zinc/manganese transport system permease protein
MSELAWMAAPIAATVLMALILGWFGLHVLERGVIFVDLALAQVAALGTTYAVYLGHEPEAPTAYAMGLLFTVLGAAAFSLARKFEDRVPQEALIGIAYAVSAGAGALLLDFASDPHGAEKLQHLMVGNIVWVRWAEIGLMAAVIGGVALAHFLARHPLLAISHDAEAATKAGMPVPWWDMAFYLTFGLVITTLVHVAGVLLIFTYLVVPAVIARLFTRGVLSRLLVAWGVALPLSVLGVSVSYEHASGPIIVVLLGGALLVALAIHTVRRADNPGRSVAGMAGTVVAIAAVLFGTSQLDAREQAHEHDHEHHEHEGVEVDQGEALPASAVEREAWYRAHADDTEALQAAASQEDDTSLELLAGTLLTRAADPAGLTILAQVAASDVPFLRMEADSVLRAVAAEDAPTFDPLAGPDRGVWAAWAGSPGEDWRQRAGDVPAP